MNTSRFCWISWVAIFLIAGCNAPNDGTKSESAVDGSDSGRNAIVARVHEPIDSGIDSFAHAAQDSPKKSLQALEEERKLEDRRRHTTGKLLPPIKTSRSIERSERNPECRDLFGKIGKYWSRDSKRGLYQFKEGHEEELKNDFASKGKCFHGLPQADFEKLLGKPDAVMWRKAAYYLSEPCLGTNGIGAKGCEYMLCEFAFDTTVAKVSIVKNPSKE
jgi:hypothetical protein